MKCYKKFNNKVLMIALLILSCKQKAADINMPTIEGQTALHFTAMVPADFSSEAIMNLKSNCPYFEKKKIDRHVDTKKAKIAAKLINAGATLDYKDIFDKTVFDYSEKNKLIMPQVYKVLQAAKVRSEVIKKYEKTKEAQLLMSQEFVDAVVTLTNYSSQR